MCSAIPEIGEKEEILYLARVFIVSLLLAERVGLALGSGRQTYGQIRLDQVRSDRKGQCLALAS